MTAAIFGCRGPSLTGSEAAFFRDVQPFGFILFKRNVDDADTLRRLTDDLRAAVGYDAPVFMDQEGGSVQRLRPPLARDWPNAADQSGGQRAVFLRHQLMAHELRAVGVDGNCAPVVDVAGPLTHPFLKQRIWSKDPRRTAALARAAAKGLLSGGVLPVIKHLPGHGAANADSHAELPRCPLPLHTLGLQDFVPVRALYDVPLGMTAHVVYEALDPDAPATQSPVVIDYLRRRLGFEGLLMTDDIGMGALDGSIAMRSRAALAAGCDVILHCSGEMAEMEEVAGQTGPLEGAARTRAEAALAARVTADEIDIAAVAAEFDALSNAEA
ncbi:glycoside hydrolase family 3 N-terminal domain-containing protein [Pararhodobacter oceanensis]|uniref:beta-N-acetylhexosaminidase n=1 Tax=Pararhodobacter oceanensis TaxID=2172121 RepID=A0A2T8HWF2_9RHOB|nr:glycoside hydrolase family 3 N-terminal domain-containing protein [Pararhodobacter oceanensis]PVH29682.1 beta-hexosaminidase [Pararhodobacter oceanensis]